MTRAAIRGRAHKYGAVRTEIDGVKFASKAEARRYSELRLLEKAGKIKDLELQPAYPLVMNGMQVCRYLADFRYWDTETGRMVVEDVKSPATKTAIYRLKAKMVKAYYGITIQEIGRK